MSKTNPFEAGRVIVPAVIETLEESIKREAEKLVAEMVD